ncbi:hypothetical protein ABZ714_29560 [Streptomyces sp. NPDC006798]|uniref:hypothetical protein n=1 Tax=Streptomyces sp. NPDC006798 TaxID=3155462 RepID=UPI0033D0DC9D
MPATVGERTTAALFGGTVGGLLTAVTLEYFVEAALSLDCSASLPWKAGLGVGVVVAAALWFAAGPDDYGPRPGGRSWEEEFGDGGGNLSCGDRGGCGGD